MTLTAAKVRSAKATGKAYRLHDVRGLYLQISAKGARWWRFKYIHADKAKVLAIGGYPEITLAEAREARDAARKAVRSGVDPSAEKQAARAAQVATGHTFEHVAEEWLAVMRRTWNAKTYAVRIQRLRKFAYPTLAQRPIADLRAADIIDALAPLEAAGKHETRSRLLQMIGRVFRYAVGKRMAEHNVAADVPARDLFTSPKVRHHAALTEPGAVGGLLRAIAGYDGSPVVRCAMQLQALTFVRPGELRHGRWDEIDRQAGVWRIPAARMKMDRDHLVPLADQALAVLEELAYFTGTGSLMFPSVRTAARPMSENTVTAALRSMGYARDQHTGHGFRTTASTLLNELGFNRDAIELQLAHAERDAVRGAYNRAEMLPERRKMLQSWADYLDTLRQGGAVVALRA